MSKIYRFLLLAFFFFSNSYAQDKTIDSLKIVLRNPKIHDTTKLAAISLTMDSHYTNNDKNYYVLNEMLGKLALKNYKQKNIPEVRNNYISWVSTYYEVLAVEDIQTKGGKKCIAYIDKAIALDKSIKDYDSQHYKMITKGAFYSVLEEMDKAVACIFEALRYYEKDSKKNADQIAYATGRLADIYFQQNQASKAILYYKKSLRFLEQQLLTNSVPQNMVEYQICSTYANLSMCYWRLKNLEETIGYAKKGLELSRKMGDVSVTSTLLCRVGLAKMDQKKFDEAEIYLKEGAALATDGMVQAHADLALGKMYYTKRDLKLAQFYGEKGFAISKQYNIQDLYSEAAALLFNIAQDKGEWKKALEMFRLHDKLVDSTKIVASRNVLEQQQLKYDFEKKELKLKLDAEKKTAVKNNWLIGLSGVLLLFVLGGFFYYRNNKQKQEIAGLEKNQIKQKLLITQMNPHFIFNSIGNIQGLINDKKDKDAVDYLTKFSKLTRQILENSNENYISLEEEVEMTKNYLSIQQLLYPSKFSFNIHIEEEINTENIFLPPMLTQPFIENAIKHGISNTENGKIDIRFYLREGKLFFEVTDNGRGFDASKRTDNHKSLAMTITKERLVNYTRNQDFVVQTDNIKDNNENVVGAKVSFEIPYIYEN